MKRLDKEYYNAVLVAFQKRQQIIEEVILRWIHEDQDLVNGLVWEEYADGTDVLRGFAGPYWAQGQLGAGQVIIQLPGPGV